MDSGSTRSTDELDSYRKLVDEAAQARRSFVILLAEDSADLAVLEAARQRADALEREVASAGRRAARTRLRKASEIDMVMDGIAVQVKTTRPDVTGRRDAVGAALDLLGATARAADVVLAVLASGGPHLGGAELVQLRREEQRQWQRAQDPTSAALLRPWYVVPALSSITLAGAPGTFCLSSWPWVDRVITSVAPRLWASQAAANVARSALEADPGRREGLKPLLGRLARGTPWGRHVWVGDMGLDDIAGIAAEEARTLAVRHEAEAQDALERLANLTEQSPEVAFWGRPRPQIAIP